MSFPVICNSCKARLKLPPGCTKKKARCPKCNARVNLVAALDATAYHPDSVASLADFTIPELPIPSNASAKPSKPSKPFNPSSATKSDTRTSTTHILPPKSLGRPTPAPTGKVEREEDPLPYANVKPAPPPVPVKPLPLPPPTTPEPLLTLDDDPPPAGSTATPVAPPPFRTPAQMTFDSTGLFIGPCEVVLVPHGMFLESVPYRPFLYVPMRSQVSLAGRELATTLPDKRSVTVEFTGPNAGQIADDAVAFLAGERPLPDLKDYRRNPIWLLWLALIFALGLAVGPLVLSQTTELGLGTGVMIAAGFAGVGLLANVAVVLFTRMSVPAKVALMATVGVLVTGVFLFAATAYLAGRKHEADQAKPEPVPQPPPPVLKPTPPEPQPVVPTNRLLTASDTAYRDGVFSFEDGTDDVTAIAMTPDGSAMLVGYKNGATKIWRFDQLPLVDPFSAGPKADGPVTRIQFDSTGNIAYLTCTGGTAAAYWNDPPDIPVKIPGEPFAAFTFPSGERFATIRRNALTIRYVPTALVKKPNTKVKGFPLLAPKDETVPVDVKGNAVVPASRLSFLAWHPTGKLLGGQPDGSIVSWGAVGPRFDIISRDHKAPVRAWAHSPANWDFATGDDKGVVGLWADKSMTPKVFTATSNAGVPTAITQLAFSPSGCLLAVVDSSGVVWVWDLNTMRSILRVKRPKQVQTLAFGPTDDLLLLSNGKAVELWHLSELAKQP
ncbi:MAG: hypothetical protein C0467_13530 [Planctomycetaceae bacterium]|nr:hypothetical protein [Planctomycetaceae bacterium]